MSGKRPVDVDQLLRDRLVELGAITGKAAKKLSKQEPSEKAKKAVAASWVKKPK